jgi:hypothetical protein
MKKIIFTIAIVLAIALSAFMPVTGTLAAPLQPITPTLTLNQSEYFYPDGVQVTGKIGSIPRNGYISFDCYNDVGSPIMNITFNQIAYTKNPDRTLLFTSETRNIVNDKTGVCTATLYGYVAKAKSYQALATSISVPVNPLVLP